MGASTRAAAARLLALLAVPTLLRAAAADGELPIRVVLVTHCGVDLDSEHGFVRMAWDALQLLQAEGEAITFENTVCADEGDVDAWAREEVDHVILMGFEVIGAVAPLVHNAPNVKFSAIDSVPDNLVTSDNMQAITFAEDEGAFLAGVLAASVSRSGRVGVVAGPPFRPVRRLANGFARGVQHACPDCTVLSQYVLSFTRPDLGAQVADYMVGEMGADVVFGAGGATGFGAIEQALTHPDALVIGVDTDQFLTSFGGGNEPGAERVVSSVMKRIDTAVRVAVLDHLAGRFNPRTVVQLDMGNEGVALAPCHLACARLTVEANRAVEIAADNVAAKLIGAELDPVSGTARLQTFFPPDVPGNSWSQLAHTGEAPGPFRAAASAHSDCGGDECIYVFGGNTVASVRGSDELFSFNLGSLSWRRHTSLNLLTGRSPPARTEATLTPLHGGPGLALFGGLGSTGARLGDLWLYVPATPFVRPLEAFVEALPTGSWPGPRAAHAAASSSTQDGALVIFGGSDGAGVLRNDLWLGTVTLLEPEGGEATAQASWTRLCDECPASARRSAAFVEHQGDLYLSGGLGASDAPMSDLWRITPRAGGVSWTPLEPLPLARGAHTAVVMQALVGGTEREEVIAMVGGTTPTDTAPRTSRSIDYFVLASSTWLTVYSHEPEVSAGECECAVESNSARVVPYRPRSAHSAFAVGGGRNKLLVLGGQDLESGSYLKQVHVFHPSESVVNEDLQRSSVVQGVSRSLGVINVLVAAGCCVWTIVKRHRAVVRASQVKFLFMMGVGALVSSCAIFPLTFDDSGDVNGLARTGEFEPGNKACGLAVVLFTTGWMTTFSFLFVKMYRISTIMSNSLVGRKVKITNKQLFLIAGTLLGVEWAIVASMFILSPLRMYRDPVAVDDLGHVTRSALTCRSALGSTYVVVLVVYHLCVLLYGAYLCFKARNIESTFAESKYVSVALVSNLQVMCIATPVLVIVADNPVSSVFVQSGVIFLNDLSVLLLIFVPKFLVDRANLDMTELISKTMGPNFSAGADDPPRRGKVAPLGALGAVGSRNDPTRSHSFTDTVLNSSVLPDTAMSQ